MGLLGTKNNAFFEIFNKAAKNVDDGAAAFLGMLENYGDRVERSKQIKDIEHVGDDLTHETVSLLNTTFITPFEREDIHELACRLDDVIDLTNVAATRMILYKIDSPKPEIVQLAQCLKHASSIIVEIVALLPKSKNVADIKRKFIAIHTQENDGDRITQQALAALFDCCHDPKDIIRWKDVYEAVERAIDRCEDVANVLETIVLKNA
jgi:hypothetical protein